MIEWLLKNKEWLFSGIGVTLLAAILNYLGRRKPNVQTADVLVRIAGAKEASAANINTLPPTPLIKVASVGPQELQDTINSAPPLQKTAVASRYKGLWIEWDTELANAEQTDDKVNLLLRARRPDQGGNMGVYVSCSVKIVEYQELAITPYNAHIRARGQIESATENSVTLSGAILSIQSPSSDAQLKH